MARRNNKHKGAEKRTSGKQKETTREKSITSYLSVLAGEWMPAKKEHADMRSWGSLGEKLQARRQYAEAKAYHQLAAVKRLKGTIVDEIIDRAVANPVSYKRIYGSGYAANYALLGVVPGLPRADSLEAELDWAAKLIKRESVKLAFFVCEERRFEAAIITGDWREAAAALDAIRKNLGVSLWYIEATLLLKQRSGGLEANKEEAKKIRGELTSELARLLTYLLSMKVEDSLSRSSYERELAKVYKNLTEPVAEKFRTLLHLHLDSLNSNTPEIGQLAFVVYHANTYGPVDLYLATVKVLQWLGVHGGQKRQAESGRRARDLAQSINDSRLHQITWWGPSHLAVCQSDAANEYADSIDLYTAGQYAHCAERLLHLLKRFPWCFEGFELLAKCEQHADCCTLSVFKPGSVGSTVLNIVRKVAARIDDGWLSRERVAQFALSIQITSLSSQLFSFVMDELQEPVSWSISAFRFATATIPTPRLALDLHAKACQHAYLESCRRSSGASLTCQLFTSVVNHVYLDEKLIAKLPAERRLKYEGGLLERTKTIAEAIGKYEALLASTLHVPCAAAYAIGRLFHLRLASGDLEGCAVLVADAYIHNSALLLGLPLHQAGMNLKEQEWLKVATDLPQIILYYLIQDRLQIKDRKRLLFRLYQTYLNARAVKKPSEIAIPVSATEQARLGFFLERICISDVIDSSTVFPSSQSLQEERIRICQMLVTLQPHKSLKYSAEIAQILKNKAVQQAINHVGQGKIYVNIAGLIRSLGKRVRERFDRYQQLRRLRGDLRTVYQVKGVSADQQIILVVVDDSAHEIFSELLHEIRDSFLWSSEFGLDSYLSVRIRHGTLSGEIRSQFEKYNLVTRKPDENAPYSPNVHWHSVIGSYGMVTRDEVDQLFKDFSQKIDDIISMVRDKWVQVRTDDKKPEAMFNFTFSPYQTKMLMVQHGATDDYDKFIIDIIYELWRQTGTLLEHVRHAILNRLGEMFSQVLTELEGKIRQKVIGFQAAGLVGTIVNCRTSIQNELNTLASWFQLPDATDVPDFPLQIAIDTSLAIIQRTFPNDSLDVRQELNAPKSCQGAFLRPIIDVLGMLLDNIIRHGDQEERFVRIGINYINSRLDISISNRIRKGANPATLKTTLSAICVKCNSASSWSSVRGEGGTGFYKIAKLMKYDMRSSTASISADVDEEGLLRVQLQCVPGESA